jgi:hypothetical protein
MCVGGSWNREKRLWEGGPAGTDSARPPVTSCGVCSISVLGEDTGLLSLWRTWSMTVSRSTLWGYAGEKWKQEVR